jgi:DNA-binding MarR family transcriptional regulator
VWPSGQGVGAQRRLDDMSKGLNVGAGRPLPWDPVAEARRNWEAHGWPAGAAMSAVTSLTRAHQIAMQRIEAVLRPLELTFARYEALALLRFTRRGKLPLGKMGERLQVHPASVTNAIDRLESAGLVRRVPHPTDGRAVLAEITDSGREVLDEATRALGGIRFGVDGLDDAAAERLTEQLAPLRRAAGDF